MYAPDDSFTLPNIFFIPHIKYTNVESIPMPVFKKPPVLPEPDWTLLIANQPPGDKMGDVLVI